jgi:DNA polymerase III subunit alpha
MFVHLRCHSHYSFLRGVNPPEEILAAALAQNMPAVALTDTNGMYAAIPFYEKAMKAGIKPILGVALDVEFPAPKEASGKPKFGTQNPIILAIVLLATNSAGYSHLCQLTTMRHLGTLQSDKDTFSKKGGRPVTLEELAAHSDGVIALCPLFSAFRMGSTKTGVSFSATYALSIAARLKEIFGDRFYIEVQHLSPGDGRILREAQHLGQSLGIPLVATNNVHFLRPQEHLHHRVTNAVRTGNLLTTVAPPEITTSEAWFKPYEQMRILFPDHPELLSNTVEIANRCDLKLQLRKPIIPEFHVPSGETSSSYLQTLCFTGAAKLYDPSNMDAQIRLRHELDVIERWNLESYFLLVWDIVKEARQRGIPAVARGSAASSIVTYCLGISRVCPLRWELYFERFLNEQRGDCPDIDIDICGARRDELLDYVYQRWGAEHVAMIGSFVTMHARLAIREVAKVFGVPHSEVNHFSKRLPHRPVHEILQAIRQLPECRTLPVDDEPWKTILQVALRLDGAPRHLSIHPCGTVISAKPLALLAPMERATKGIVVTQYDMNTIEALGLIKMDLLGQRGFTTMSLALDNIEKNNEWQGTTREKTGSTIAADGVTPCPKPRELNFDAIPENDLATCDVIAAGRTMGIFQIESPAMRSMLRMMAARKLDDVALALALIRPGAAEYGSKELFIKRLNGEQVTFAHPSLAEILRNTLGVCIYQEQVMQIAQAVGQMSLLEADLVRRSAAKFSGQDERDRLREKFLKAAEQMGLEGAALEETWMMVEKFAGFGFCKAHAATYADISYRMSYLKTHHTAEFLAAMCSAGAGFYHVSAYVEEAKRWGIEVRLPSVNHSQMEYIAEAETTEKRALRVGLMQIRGLRVETILALLREREEHSLFLSLEDFLARVPAERDEVEALIKCGAFDEVCHSTRAAMLWQWNLLQAKGQRTQQGVRAVCATATTTLSVRTTLFAEMEHDDSIELALREIDTADYTQQEKLRHEREILEVCVSGHPLDFLPRNGETWSNELSQLHGKRVTLCGWVVTYRHVGTKNYRNMMFVTLEDQRGLYEVILFPDAYDKYGGLVYETRAMRVTGMVQDDEHINGEMLERLKEA